MSIAVGIIFTIVGILAFVTGLLKKLHCTEITIGKVVDISRDLEINHYYNGNSINNSNQYDRYRGGREINLYPIFEYTVGENTYVKKSSSSSNQYHIGQDVTIHYNPSNPDQYYVNGIYVSMIAGIIFGIVGIVIAIIGG